MRMLRRYLKIVVESIFPERPDHALVKKARADAVLDLLSPTTADEIVYLLPFKDPLVRAAIHEAKFQGNAKAWRLLATALETYLKQLPDDTVVVPIPLSLPRRLKRGYNQVAVVARLAAKGAQRAKLQENILYRRHHTKAQTGMRDRADRIENMKGAFGIRDPKAVTDRNIIILDDVTTTGATLKAARSVLKEHHPRSVTLLALSH